MLGGGIGAPSTLFLAVLHLFDENPLAARRALNLLSAGVLVLGLWTFVTYIKVFFPVIPPALGGLQSRCAQLDLKRDALSARTVKELLPGMDAGDTAVVRSKPLDVLFMNTELVVIRVPGSANHYELRRETIDLVSWCSK